MKYVVFQSGGKQYRVSEGDVVELERLNLPLSGQEVRFDEVLLYVSDKTLRIGKPFVKGITAKGKLLENIKGEKIRVAKYRAKVRYRKVMGHRQLLSRVKIEEIS